MTEAFLKQLNPEPAHCILTGAVVIDIQGTHPHPAQLNEIIFLIAADISAYIAVFRGSQNIGMFSHQKGPGDNVAIIVKHGLHGNLGQVVGAEDTGFLAAIIKEPGKKVWARLNGYASRDGEHHGMVQFYVYA